MDYLQNIFNDLSAQFGSNLPRLIGALILLLIGLFVARIIRGGARKAFANMGVDRIIKGSNFKLSSVLSKLLYFILVLVILTLVLEMMGLTSALDPVKDMLRKFLGYIPNIIAAGIIAYVGYIVANIGKEAVGMISNTLGSFTDKYGLTQFNLGGILRQLVFIFIFVPILLVALDALNISMISDPAKHMLQSMFDAIPNIIAAAVILAVFIIGGKFVSSTIKELLVNLNVDSSAQQMGLTSMIGDRYSISSIAEKIIYFFICFFGITTAIEKLNFDRLGGVMQNLLDLSGNILFGMIILLIGNRISSFVSDYFAKSDAPALSSIARFATLGLFLAISLRYMGLADEIVNLAFGLTLGAVAVAFALSFGLGGREAAGKQMEKFFNKF